MNIIVKTTAACLLAGMLALPIGCEGTIDCFTICDRYSDCVTNIDVTECWDLCEDRADRDETLADNTASCETCIDDAGSCSAVRNCFDRADCNSVVVPVEE